MKNSFLFLLLALFFFACEEDNEKPPFDNTTFFNNHEAAKWTKETAKKHLQGRWELIYTYCCPLATNTSWVAADDDLFALQFEGDSIRVYSQNKLESSQLWSFDERYEGSFLLETKEAVSRTFGTIYFSENYMLFLSSPMDGADYYYEKVD